MHQGGFVKFRPMVKFSVVFVIRLFFLLKNWSLNELGYIGDFVS